MTATDPNPTDTPTDPWDAIETEEYRNMELRGTPLVGYGVYVRPMIYERNDHPFEPRKCSLCSLDYASCDSGVAVDWSTLELKG